MKRATLVLVLTLILGAVLFSVAEARPAAADTSWPLEYILDPCPNYYVQPGGAGPARVVCMGKTGRWATINVPTPWLSDRAPELSLVGIPTYFNVDWDEASQGVQDSAPLTISNPIGDPTDRLVNVHVQLRLRPADPIGPSGNYRMVSGNLALDTTPLVYIMGLDPQGPNYSLACSAALAPGNNALLTVRTTLGGLGDCAAIEEKLAPVTGYFPAMVAGAGEAETERYPGWNRIESSRFLTFTPYASVHGAGTDHGSPAFQITATTRFVVEARILFSEQQHKVTTVTTDCQWSYWNDYDFKDWSLWPDPIYCRYNVTVTWPTFCKVWGTPSCEKYYGHPDTWWRPLATDQAQAIRRPDGSYGQTYDFVSVQSQALLTAP